ncbi:NAD-dependent epimerase/dehydratase family protein [Paenibacillus senegalensis]|uniref:NAD-dependent epimerase/dehydratase family protein n=1 Tax=Paenibacillus senegalensis TaxID=1465766 RepID=UPI00028A119C|nr:NAD-dependent epimerase/dehydratase family protein [Paenibacillus senegalensis]
MNVLVTGGTGFLGRRLALRLQNSGLDVTAAGRNMHIGRRLQEEGIRFAAADLRLREEAEPLIKGQDVVFHCAALSSPWGRYEDFYESNVLATKWLTRACLSGGVSRLVYVSTPSVYFNYKNRLDIKEDTPFPPKPANLYAKTKIMAEQIVDRASAEGLPVITIRPRALFGPGDTTILPRLIEANARGRLPLIDGGRALIDATYVDNVVDALVLAMKAPAELNGRKYNITNGEPLPFKQLLDNLFTKLDQPMRPIHLSYRKAMIAAAFMEGSARLFRKNREPQLTRYTVGVIARSQTLDIQAAIQELGYRPSITIDEGLDRFVQWWKERRVEGAL